MGVLLIVFVVAIAYATFIENDYDATTARMLIYNARWFEVLMLLMVINFTGMIYFVTIIVYSPQVFSGRNFICKIDFSFHIIIIGYVS